ncbi:MAG: o-succinylbenzoate synthase [Bacteroidia bacterium]|nr:o-succinylbenzoate synthase [Bacteroidia bacterium]NNJ56563.1 o-succinylbenzoate synthase [Bacteroidia bacterium]
MLTFDIKPYELVFNKPAKTSRNVFEVRKVFVVSLFDSTNGRKGIGEAAPLSLLSIDDIPNYEEILKEKATLFCSNQDFNELELDRFPSIRFGLETAFLDLKSTEGRLFETPFTKGDAVIPINGLVWMNDTERMYQEALQKIDAGFKVIKFKVGAQDFDDECRMLERIRSHYSAFKITIRLDANGAFKPDEAAEQLKELKRFEIHSIEQPIAKDNWDEMEELCYERIIDVALDEELIGVSVEKHGYQLLNHLKPQYIILKPNLLGGLSKSDEWISLANNLNIKWWATSALEGNIGLSAIAQWVSKYETQLHQGLGTGSLFKNNFKSPLQLEKGVMSFKV